MCSHIGVADRRAELTSPTSGKVAKLVASEGQTVRVGQTLCEIHTDGDESVGELAERQDEVNPVADGATAQPYLQVDSDPSEATASPAVQEAEQATEKLEKSAESNRGDEHLLRSRDAALDSASDSLFSGEATLLPSAPRRRHPLDTESAPVVDRAEAGPSQTKKLVKASPAVRTLAMKLGVELSGVQATGEGGRVTKEDVQGAVSSSGAPKASRTETSRTYGRRETAAAVTRVEFGRTRRVMWKALGEQGSVPHFG